jgi:uncharacterized protein (TIGR03905 family)
MEHVYYTKGTCSKEIHFDLQGNVVRNVQFISGCPGNTIGVSRLVDGMTVEEIEKQLKGIRCGAKLTSCPDQLAIAVRQAYERDNG